MSSVIVCKQPGVNANPRDIAAEIRKCSIHRLIGFSIWLMPTGAYIVCYICSFWLSVQFVAAAKRYSNHQGQFKKNPVVSPLDLRTH